MSQPASPIRRVVLFKHGIGHFERESKVVGDSTLTLTFKQSEVSDVLKSLTVLDEGGGHVSSVSYDSTKPLEKLLSEVAIDIPDQGSLVGLLPQVKGARVRLHTGVSEPIEGNIVGIDSSERSIGDAVVRVTLLSVLTELGEVRSYDLYQLAGLQILDVALRRDLDFYLKTQLSSKKKDSKSFTFFAQGEGERTIRMSYTLEAPVWKATYRILLGEEGKGPMIQGWAVVDNTQDEDWEDVQLSLISGLPVSFRHDLYTPRYIRRPEVAVRETTGVLPPEMEDGMMDLMVEEAEMSLRAAPMMAMAPPAGRGMLSEAKRKSSEKFDKQSALSSTPTQVRERKIGDLFEYEIEHPVTIRRNQSALVPIVLREFAGQPVLLYNKANRAENPIRCVDFKNSTGLTLEGGPVTVIESGRYVGEAMLETIKPDEDRLVPYSVELSVRVLDNVESFTRDVHKVVIRKKTFVAHAYQVQQTVYQFDNRSSQEYSLALEHPRMQGWSLFDTPKAAETTENLWRFRTSLPPGVSKFTVKQKSTQLTRIGLADFRDEHLSLWIENDYLDKSTVKSLRALLALQHEVAGIEAVIKELDAERDGVHKEQGRIRDNLKALGDRPSEKELRERYVASLGAHETRLGAIAEEIKAKKTERDASRARVETALSQIEFEKDLASPSTECP